jgi:hypothetical protein
MKQTLLIISFLFVLYGCKKSDDNARGAPDGPAPTSSASSFSAKVNNILYTADSARGYVYIDTSLVIPIRSFILMGYCGSKIIVPGFGDLTDSTLIPVLNYDSIQAGAYIDYINMNDTLNEFEIVSAKFKITSSDAVLRKISGSFSGVMVGDVTGDTVVITNGVFTNIIYQDL